MRQVWAMVAVGLLVACSATDPGVRDGPIIVLTGNGQSAPVGTPVSMAPSVRVWGNDGLPSVGTWVHFSVNPGNGTIYGDSVATDGDGVARVVAWVLGTAAGVDTLHVTASGFPGSATVTAQAVPGPAAAIHAVGSPILASLVGQAVSPSPTVMVQDTYQNPVPNVSVTFYQITGQGSISGATVTTNAQGQATLGSWVLGTSAGTYQVTARTLTGLSQDFIVHGLASPPQITASSPTTQSGFLAFGVPKIPRVMVKDAQGTPLPGVPVTFALVGGGDATLTGGAAITGADGVAAPTDWRLGKITSSSTVTASMPDFPGSSVSFTVTGTVSPYTIDVRFTTSMTPNQRDVFVAAAMRWMQIITGDLPDVAVNLSAGACGSSSNPAMNETVDDLVIYAQIGPIDGVGNILGSAGPCVVRSGSSLPAVGSMRFDVADLQTIEANGQLQAVITHEMAHVLGFGTIWTARGVNSGIGGADPVFTGPAALGIWPTFNLGYSGTPIPLENIPIVGTRDVHWRESVFHAELMTGYVEAPGLPMPLSKMTIASMQDIGYAVNYNAADVFAGNLLARGAIAAPAMVLNEEVRQPLWEVLPDGTTKRRGQE